MKANRIFPNSGYKSRVLSYWAVVILSALIFISMYFISSRGFIYGSSISWDGAPGFFSSDSISYFSASDVILSGNVDIVRTPVYPAIIGFFRLLCGDTFMFPYLFFFQYIVFLFSAVLLSRIALRFINNLRAAFWTTAIYLLLPSYISFNLALLTESLSISLMIFLVWFVTRQYPNPPSILDNIFVGLVLILMIFLRPIFLYLLPVLLFYYILLLIRFRKNFIASFAVFFVGILFTCGCLKIYKDKIHSEYGISTITNISILNNTFTSIEAVGLHPELTKDAELRDLLTELKNNENLSSDQKICRLLEYADNHWSEYEEYVNNSLRISPASTLKLISMRIIDELPRNHMIPNYYLPSYIFVDYLLFFSQYYVIIVWYIIICIRQVIRTRSIPYLSILFIMLTLCLTVSSAIGAMSEWGRLTFPTFILFVIITVKLISLYHLRKSYSLP